MQLSFVTDSSSGVLTFQRAKQILWVQPQHAGLSFVLLHVLAVLDAMPAGAALLIPAFWWEPG